MQTQTPGSQEVVIVTAEKGQKGKGSSPCSLELCCIYSGGPGPGAEERVCERQ